MFTSFKRVLGFAVSNFFRNKGMSVAAIFMLIATTLLITSIFFLRGASDYLIQVVQDKIDVTAYFKADVAEQDILQVKDELARNSESIKNIEYVSRGAALEQFIETHPDDEVFLKALEEVGGNPFLPSLNIITQGSPQDYEKIAQVLSQDAFTPLIEKVDYSQKKDTIEKVFAITSSINRFGIGLAVFLIIVVMLVVFNTTKLVIENSKDEISTMRIIGASSWFVRAPFIIEGAIFGFVSFFLCFIITMLAAFLASPSLAVIMPGFSLSGYFTSNILIIILIQLVCGMGLGAFASFIVVRKYLKV